MEYLISSVIGYILGSIPTGYILLKKQDGIDLTKNGSGNVGAMNTFRLSKSKITGVIVLLIDLAKGAGSALVPFFIYPGEFIFPALAVLFAVFGHCYSPWIGFKGGRGLAAAAGGALIIFPYLLVVWCILWVIFFLMRKQVLFANIGATVLSVLLIFSTDEIAIKYTTPKTDEPSIIVLITTAVLMVIFIKHIDPLKDLAKKQFSERLIKK